MSMKFDTHHDKDGHLKYNPSWFFQLAIIGMVGMIGYFLASSMEDIKSELELSRIERAQIRADLTAFQIGAAGDRFTRTQWTEERARLEVDLDDIRNRITKLEAEH